jgi:hypothetical protein
MLLLLFVWNMAVACGAGDRRDRCISPDAYLKTQLPPTRLDTLEGDGIGGAKPLSEEGDA